MATRCRFNLTDFDSVVVNAGAGDDSLTINAPGAITKSIDFAGSSGTNSLTLASGALGILTTWAPRIRR
jgi:hypothetical protein